MTTHAFSLTARITIGINKGYNHSNESELKDSFNTFIMDFLEVNEMKIGRYIPFVVNRSKVIYKKDWGCPDGGEDTFTLEATANPYYVPDLVEWRSQVIKCAELLKDALQQSTVTIQFYDSDVIYLE